MLHRGQEAALLPSCTKLRREGERQSHPIRGLEHHMTHFVLLNGGTLPIALFTYGTSCWQLVYVWLPLVGREVLFVSFLSVMTARLLLHY